MADFQELIRKKLSEKTKKMAETKEEKVAEQKTKIAKEEDAEEFFSTLKEEEKEEATEIEEEVEEPEEPEPEFEEEKEEEVEETEEVQKVKETKKVEKVVETPKKAEAKKVVQKSQQKIEKPVKKVTEDAEREIETGSGLVLQQKVREVEGVEEMDIEIDTDQMIKMELEPDAVHDYVVIISGKPVLTYAGILRAATLRGNIHITDIKRIERTSRRVVYIATVHDLEKNVILHGIGVVDLDIEEEKIKRLKEKYKHDPYRIRNYDEQLARMKEYMEQIAFSRAQRNALRAVINERDWAYKIAKIHGIPIRAT